MTPKASADLGVGGVDQRLPLRPEPEHDHRQVRRGQAESGQHLPAARSEVAL